MPLRNQFSGVLLLCTILSLHAQQPDNPPPSIVQPGAPGTPGRTLTPSEAKTRYRPPTAADIEFMQMMIIHHSQAVDMVDLLLRRGSLKELKELGRRISLSQADEIASMKQWLVAHGQPLAPEHQHHAHHMHTPGMDMGDIPVMNGMLSPNQMKRLAASSGRNFDYLFLTGMIQHHTGALDMVADLLAAGGAEQDPTLFDFVTDIDNTQSAEIKIMREMLTRNKLTKAPAAPTSQKVKK